MVILINNNTYGNVCGDVIVAFAMVRPGWPPGHVEKSGNFTLFREIRKSQKLWFACDVVHIHSAVLLGLPVLFLVF